MPIDADYYIEQQLKPPLMRLFEPVIGQDQPKVAAMLFDGDKARKVATPSKSAKGGLGAFIRRGERCLACRAALPNANAFCAACEGTDKAAEVRSTKFTEGRSLRAQSDKLVSTCDDCTRH